MTVHINRLKAHRERTRFELEITFRRVHPFGIGKDTLAKKESMSLNPSLPHPEIGLIAFCIFTLNGMPSMSVNPGKETPHPEFKKARPR